MIKVRQYPKGKNNSDSVIKVMLDENHILFYSGEMLICVICRYENKCFIYTTKESDLLNFQIQDKNFVVSTETNGTIKNYPVGLNELNRFASKFINTKGSLE